MTTLSDDARERLYTALRKLNEMVHLMQQAEERAGIARKIIYTAMRQEISRAGWTLTGAVHGVDEEPEAPPADLDWLRDALDEMTGLDIGEDDDNGD